MNVGNDDLKKTELEIDFDGRKIVFLIKVNKRVGFQKIDCFVTT